MTQTSTAIAEESASASQELTSQAEMLKSMVARFKLENAKNESQKPRKSPPALRAESSPQRRQLHLSAGEFGKY